MARAAGTRFRVEWDTTIKRLAALLSAGAAGVSILSFLAGRGTASSRAAAAVAAVAETDPARIEVTPAADTAFAVGDTLPLTALAADARGLALTGARVHWLSDDSAVAVVDSAGQVVAHGPGVTAVTVALGGRAARARIWVIPRVAALALEGDSVLRLAEGETRRLQAVARDARGHLIPAAQLQWSTADREVAVADTGGEIRGVAPGVTTLTVTAGGLLAQRRVEVMPVPASLTLIAGAGQRAAAGQRLAGRIGVQVVSRSGRPVPGALVRFQTGAGGGRAEPDSVVTDTRGLAEAAWILGPVPGRQRLAVQVAPIDSPLVALAEADPVPLNTRITLLTDTLAGTVGAAGAEPVVIQVTDSSGTSLADIPVAWAAQDGGSFAALDTRTDSLGQARAVWTFGPRAGRQRARVQVGNPRTLPPLRLSAPVQAAAPVAVRLLSGGGQRGPAGTLLPDPVILQAVDRFGNPVAGAPIRLATPQGGATDSLVQTGADGRARVRWTLSVTAGATSLVARLAGSEAAIQVPATALPAAPAKLRFASALGAGTAGQPLARTLQVSVTDRFGNPVPGAVVSFRPSAGRVSPLRAATDQQGIAMTRWTLGLSAGKQTLVAEVKATRARVGLSVTVRPPARAGAAPTPPPAARPEPKRSPFGTVVP